MGEPLTWLDRKAIEWSLRGLLWLLTAWVRFDAFMRRHFEESPR